MFARRRHVNSSAIDEGGRTTYFFWRADGQTRSLLEGGEHKTRFFCDEAGFLVSVVNADGVRTDVSNDARGLPVGVMRHDGLIERRRYDAHRRLVELTDFSGGVTRFERDGFGRVAAILDPSGATTRYEYGPGGDFWTPIRMIRPDGGVSVGKRLPDGAFEVVDSEGRRTVYRYGPFDLLREIQDSKGGVLCFAYDSQKRLVEVRNQVGRRWRFERDACGRVARESDFDDLVIAYAYDKAGRLSQMRHADETRIAYTYDGAGLTLRVDVYETSQPSPVATTSYDYDGRGYLANAANGWGSVAFERNGVGAIVSETQSGRTIASELECCGRRTKRRIGDRLIEAAYDPLGALASLRLDGSAALAFTRDAMGRETSRVHEAGFRLDQTYDRVGQLLRQSVAGAGRSAGPVVDRTYRWSKSYEPQTISDRRWGETHYAYDRAGQVTQALFGDGRGERYEYDPALNVFAGAETGAALTWLSSPGGRVKAAREPFGEKIFLTHDVRGRVIERRVERDGFRPRLWRYEWDGKDRLVSCLTPDGDRWRYGYDPFGRRLFKRREARPGMAARPGERIGVAYLWDGDVVAQEAPLLAGSGPDWAASTQWHFEPNGFRPLARQEASAQGGPARTLYVVNDHLGTPRELTDESGALVWSASLSLWGAARAVSTPAPGGRHLANSGRLALAELGEELRARACADVPQTTAKAADCSAAAWFSRFVKLLKSEAEPKKFVLTADRPVAREAEPLAQP